MPVRVRMATMQDPKGGGQPLLPGIAPLVTWFVQMAMAARRNVAMTVDSDVLITEHPVPLCMFSAQMDAVLACDRFTGSVWLHFRTLARLRLLDSA